MKFMEIDDGGYVHHICDDPTVTIVPLKNRIRHNDKNGKPLVDAVGADVSLHGNRWLPPLLISDVDFSTLMSEGLTGSTPKGTKWHHKYDAATKTFTKATIL